MLPKEDIEMYGGKGAILNYIKEKCPNLPIPPYSYNHKDFKHLKKPMIVRSSSPYEYGDFEGIFASVPNVNKKGELRDARWKLKQSARSEFAKKYAKQNGFEIGKKIKMIFQEQSPSVYKGAMIRLPNNPDIVYINFFTKSGTQRENFHYFYNQKKKEIIEEMEWYSSDAPFKDIGALVDSYMQIESLKEIADGYSLYVEFGLKPFAIFQARPFKKIETTDFDLPKVSGEYQKTDLCMGLTRPDGIVLPFVRCPSSTLSIATLNLLRSYGELDFNFSELESQLLDDLLEVLKKHPDTVVFDNIPDVIRYEEMKTPLTNHLHNSDNKFKEGYCLMMDSAIREEYPVDLYVPHMHTFVQGVSYDFLTHGIIRLLKKAEISLLASAINYKFFKTTDTGDNVRVISNGKEAIVFKE